MLEELNRASGELCIALDKYLTICTFVRDSCLGNNSQNSDPSFHSGIESEWNRFVGHKSKLKQAQAAINATRNVRTAATIHSLPLELLTRIFSLVVDDRPCSIIDSYHHIYLRDKYRGGAIQYPDALTHVCSLWRRVSIGIPRLWAHIDIALNHPRNPGLFARATTFAARAGATPLHIHLCDPGFRRDRDLEILLAPRGNGKKVTTESQRDPKTMHDFDFLPPTPIHVESLDIWFGPEGRLRDCHLNALEYFLARCTPGVLNRFSIRLSSDTFNDDYFIEPADNPLVGPSALLAIPSQHLEEIWHHVPTIRADGPCPPWSSKAFHGLVELRLGERAPRISEFQLVSMLRSSPKLRVFHLRTELEETTPVDEPVVPIRLGDLEELDIKEENEDDAFMDDDFGSFLRWIAPGTKPLQLNYQGYPVEDGPALFCARSNVTRLFSENFLGESIVDMVRRSAWLEVLAINAGGVENLDLRSLLWPVDPRQSSHGLVPATQVDTLYLRQFNRVPFSDIQEVVRNYSVKRLVLCGTSISYETSEGQNVRAGSQRDIAAKLSTLNPVPTIEFHERRSPLDPEHWWR